MDSGKLDTELDFLSGACRQAMDKHVLVYQLIANLLAAVIACVCGIIAVLLLEKGVVAKVFGFVIGVIGLGGAGIILAAGAGAILRRIFAPPASSYESPWVTALQFLHRNCPALVGGYTAFFAAFVVLLCLLLIPIAAAQLGTLGQLLYAVLLIPMVVVAALAVLSLLAGVFITPAEVALRERALNKTISSVFGNTFARPLKFLCMLGTAYIACFLVSLPIFSLLAAALFWINGLAISVVGVAFTAVPVTVMSFFLFILIAAAASLPVACFTVITGLRYRQAVGSEEKDAPRDVES